MSEAPTASQTGPATAAAHNLPEFTVSEISQAVKRTLEGSFERVRVRGEVSQPKYHSSGHLYLRLKDENAVLEAVCWRGTVGRLRLRIEEGMEVIATGRITTYPGGSKYQIVIDSVELAGEGALLKLLEDRRRKLAAEGLFDEARKKPIPLLPDVIGVVTSPTGAVIRDILHRLADRFPRRVLIWPVAVQGEGAAAQIAAAIRGFDALAPGGTVPRPDVLIVARGGGSLEDLWAFNEEVVVRAAADCTIPLISAVGHETDTTLIDFASDRRAPTPTAAAEMAVPVRAELLAEVMERGRRMVGAMNRLVAERRVQVEGLGRGLPQPQRLLEDKAQRLDGWVERLANSCGPYIATRADRLARLAAALPTPREQIFAKARDVERLSDALRHKLDQMLTTLGHRSERAATGLRPQLLTDLLRRHGLALDSCARLLESYSYEGVLARGFVLVRDAAGGPVIAAAAVAPGQELHLQFHDGEIAAVAEGAPRRRAGPKPKTGKDDQGSLL
jgi:exodeoxyribonuclease VII large subunit